MDPFKTTARVAGLVVALAACSGEPAAEAAKPMTVQGTVSQGLVAKDMAAVAIGKDGRVYWSLLATNGDFKIDVPSGQSYRLFLSKPTTGGRDALVGKLTFTGVAGKTSWFTPRATVLRLGSLVPMSAVTTKPAPKSDPSGIAPAARGSGRGGTDCSCDDDDHDDYDDDKEHEDDPPSHSKPTGGNACGASSTPEVGTSRNGADDVADSCDYSGATSDADQACTPGAGGSATGAADGTTPNTGGGAASAPDPNSPPAGSDGSIVLR